MNCGNCAHWNLTTGPQMGVHGFGRCDARPPGAMRDAITTSARNICRLGKHQPAPIAVVRQRESEGRGLL
jgi:hypothetical protein